MQSQLADYSGDSRKVNWEELLESVENPPDYTYLSPKEAGLKIHEWIFDQFSYMDIEFNGWIKVWKDGKAKPIRYDAYDGTVVYDFKTKKTELMSSVPYYNDIAQMESYLRELEEDRGVIVYIDRENFDVREVEVTSP